MKHKKLLMIVGAAVAGLAIIGAAIIFRINSDSVKLKTKSITIEAGEELDTNLEELVRAKEDVMKELAIDSSQVNTKKVGNYKLIITYKEKEYKIKVSVVDTTAPKATFKHRYLFTNNISECDANEIYHSVEEYSAYKTEFTYFEKAQDLTELTDDKLTALEESIIVPCDQKALAKKSSKKEATEEGIYNAIFKFEDEHGNVQYEEVFVILDKTAPVIEDKEDETIETSDLNTKPTVNPDSYKITDNVDGAIVGANINCNVELTDEKNHVYINHVSYTDRAGNTATADFKITLVYKKDTNNPTANVSSSEAGNKTSSGGGSASGGNGSTSTKPSGSQSSSSDQVEEDTLYPGEQAAVNAGYYQVVVDSDGDYWVLVPSFDENDKGIQLIKDYLAQMGYEPASLTGHNLGGPNWNGKDYIVVCTKIREKSPTIDDDDFWRE